MSKDIKTVKNNKDIVKHKEKNPVLNNTIREILNIDNISKIGTPLNNILHERFCLIYSVTLDGTNSYLIAAQEYNKNNGTERSENINTAGKMAHDLLKREDVRTRLAEITDYTAQSLQINKTQIIEDIKNELNANIADVITWNSDGTATMKGSCEIPDHILRLIQSFKQTKDGRIEVKFYDKQKARDQLMKYLGMLNEGPQVNINLDLGRAMEEMHARVVSRRKSGAVDAEYEEVD